MNSSLIRPRIMVFTEGDRAVNTDMNLPDPVLWPFTGSVPGNQMLFASHSPAHCLHQQLHRAAHLHPLNGYWVGRAPSLSITQRSQGTQKKEECVAQTKQLVISGMPTGQLSPKSHTLTRSGKNSLVYLYDHIIYNLVINFSAQQTHSAPKLHQSGHSVY